jgi:aryl-alcohol dehydrogenase-like predicted oxidoreductase
MQASFHESILGRTGLPVKRLGLSTSYFPGKKAVHYALDHGVNFFFGYGWDRQMMRVLRDLSPAQRQGLVIATGGYNWILFHSNLRKALEKRLRQLHTDCLDVFLFLGVMKPKQYSEAITAEMIRFREEGKVRAIGLSCHDRKFLGELAERGDHDVLMQRYNAVHRGAEQDIFPHLATHHPGVVSYTATAWTKLIRRPKKYPKDARLPTAGEAYRFVLSNENVNVCLTAPMNLKQLKANLAAVEEGPLLPEDMAFMRNFGDFVHEGSKALKWDERHS